jgi:hypothetical protein
MASSARADTLALLTAANIRIDGANAADMVGTTVAVVGDQNGDGRPDIAIGVSQAGNANQDTSGSVYVVYSQAAPTVVSLANLGPAGYRIDGANAFDAAGTSVASGVRAPARSTSARSGRTASSSRASATATVPARPSRARAT